VNRKVRHNLKRGRPEAVAAQKLDAVQNRH
jgi:hypothetical protein